MLNKIVHQLKLQTSHLFLLKKLIHNESSWYVSDDISVSRLTEEVDSKEVFREGGLQTVTINKDERSSAAREKCLVYHGHIYVICGFKFENFYGEIGKNYIHVHHIIPISEIKAEYELNPISDLIPICPNCHSMIHITRPALSIAEFR